MTLVSRSRPFNSPLETGLRVLFVLEALDERPCDLQRLISYDYLLVHSGDVEKGPPSLHPSVPYRGTEWLVKRDVVSAGMDQMFSRELVEKLFQPSGILYRKTALTSAFLGLLKSRYAVDLRLRATWLVRSFSSFSDSDLEGYMSGNVGRWGAEFEQLSAIADLEL